MTTSPPPPDDERGEGRSGPRPKPATASSKTETSTAAATTPARPPLPPPPTFDISSIPTTKLSTTAAASATAAPLPPLPPPPVPPPPVTAVRSPSLASLESETTTDGAGDDRRRGTEEALPPLMSAPNSGNLPPGLLASASTAAGHRPPNVEDQGASLDGAELTGAILRASADGGGVARPTEDAAALSSSAVARVPPPPPPPRQELGQQQQQQLKAPTASATTTTRAVGGGRPIPAALRDKVDEDLAKRRVYDYDRMDSAASSGHPPLSSSVPISTAAVDDAPPAPRQPVEEEATTTERPQKEEATRPTPTPTTTTATAEETKAKESRPARRGTNRPRAVTIPTLSTLAPRQCRIPVLLVPTASSRLVAEKNYLTLGRLFTALGETLSDADAVNSPRLPPFRSATRSMALNWEDVKVDFIEMDVLGRPVDDSDSEVALAEAAMLWEEDGDESKDADQLEMRLDGLIDADHLGASRGRRGVTDDEKGRGHGGDDEKEDGQRQQPKHHHRAGENFHEESFNESDAHPDDDIRLLEKFADDAYALTSPPVVPWMLRYRSVLDQSTSNLTHEMFGSPPLCLLIASTSDVSPLDCLAELANVHHLPRPFQNGWYDPNAMRREFLLLHDEADGPGEFDEGGITAEMQRRFGVGNCAVLRLNSVLPRPSVDGSNVELEETEEEDPLWDRVLSPGLPPCYRTGDAEPLSSSILERRRRGACLSERDRLAIRSYLGTLICNGLLPAIERRISSLNTAVSNAKKGVKNVLKSFWRKPRESPPSGTGVPGTASGSLHPSGAPGAASAGTDEIRYRHDSIESQIRLLADTLFLLRDYDAALGMYRLVRDDYKHDRSMLHHASCHEMIALCLHQLDPNGTSKSGSGNGGREAFQSVEAALYAYTRAADEERQSLLQQQQQQTTARPAAAPRSTRLATRLCLVLSSSRFLSSPDRSVDVADLLASASSHETPLGAAVLLEQSSAHYYRASMYRKYAFHMLMAGHMFRSADQTHHAFRCFAAAFHVYHGGRWDELRDHLRSALAAQLYGMGRSASSLRLYARLLGTNRGGRVSVRSQQKFLNHLLEICRDRAGEALVGADRMLPPLSESLKGTKARMQKKIPISSSVDGEARASVAEILRSTPAAVRTLEIPSMDLPRVNDSSLTVVVDTPTPSAEVLKRMRSSTLDGGDNGGTTADGTDPLGSDAAGVEAVWEDLMATVQAELRVAWGGADPALDEDDTANAGNEIDRVILEIDKEKNDAAFLARSKKKGGGVGGVGPELRARREPLAASFRLSNPLGVPVPLSEMQLVAVLRTQEGGDAGSPCVFSNEHAILVVGGGGRSKKRHWTFHGSRGIFEAPEFARLSKPTTSARDGLCPRTTWTSTDDPYFVVTKATYSLEPGTETTVTLNICPLVEGDLEILGVRCKLFKEIWVYHPFRVLGPLLQDTRLNRANRVRGESYLLKSKVEHDMPSLSVDLLPKKSSLGSSAGGPVLQGQLSSWMLRVANLGTATACNITLKTNVPWVNIIDNSDSREGSANHLDSDKHFRATSHCIGPSGTLMFLPLQNREINETRKDESIARQDILRPGDSVDIPVLIRTSGGGRQDFYMLFRYELWDENQSEERSISRHIASSISSSSFKRNVRWLRKMLSVPVYPSLTLSASLMQSYWRKRDHVVSIEMTNYRSDGQPKLDIKVERICIASRHYRVVQLAGQLGELELQENEAKKELSLLGIGWQERVTMHFLIIPLEKEEYTFSACRLLGEDEDVASSSVTDLDGVSKVTDFVCLEHAHEKFRSAIEAHNREVSRLAAEQEKEGQHPRSVAQIRRAKSSIPPQEAESKSSLTPRRISHSSSEPLELEKLHHSQRMRDFNESMRSLPALYHPTSVTNLCPPTENSSKINIICSWSVKDNATAGDEIIYGQHHLRELAVRPYTRSKGCPLTITARHKLDIRHDFSHGPLKIDLEVTVRNRLVDSQVEFDFFIERQKEVEFVGLKKFKWELAGGDEIVVPLQAIILSSGIHNLQSLRLTVLNDGVQVPYLFPLQWLVKVNTN